MAQYLPQKLTLSPTSYLLTQSTTRQQVSTKPSIVIPSGGWITTIGVWARRVSGNARLALGIWQQGADDRPAQLLARTNPILITTTTGNYEAPIVWTNPTVLGGKATALRVDSHQVIYLGWVIGSNPSSAEVGQDVGGDVVSWTADNTTGIPLNPFGAPADIGSVDRVRMFCLFNDATPPTVTLNAPPANGVDDAPTFVGTFSDVDIIPYGDTIERYDIQVREENALTYVWNVRDILASATEQRDHVITRPYAGPDLVGGITYQWRIRARDMAGNWTADYTPWRPYNLLDRGVVDVSTFASPTGKVDGDLSAIQYSARWWHTQDLATTHVQVQLYDAHGTAITGKKSPEIPKVVSAADSPPGTDFTITASEAAFGALIDGKIYKWAIRAKDTDGVWSPFSTQVAFHTNDVPSTPKLISPAEDSHSTVRPKLVATTSDSDIDDVPLVDVVWDIEVRQEETGTVRTAMATDYDVVNEWASYLTTVDTVPTSEFGIFFWRMRGRDLSAGDYGIGVWSDWFRFRYGAGPEVVITNPAEGETQLTTTPRIDWTTDDAQSYYQITIWNVVNNVRATRKFQLTTAASEAVTSYDVPASAKLENKTTYEVTVGSWNTATPAVLGSSTPRRFTIDYDGPPGLADVAAAVVTAAGDIEPTTPAITWVKSTHPQFYAYVVQRWDGVPGPRTTSTILKELTNKDQTKFYDYHAPPNTLLTYGVSQKIKTATGAPQLSEETTAAALRVELITPVVVAVASPATLRFPVMWLGQNLQAGIKRRRSTYQTWGTGGVPTASTAPGGQKLRQVGFTIIGDNEEEMRWTPQTLNAHRAAVEAVILAGGVVSWRDEYEQLFMEITDYSIARGRLGQMDVALRLEEVAYKEGGV